MPHGPACHRPRRVARCRKNPPYPRPFAAVVRRERACRPGRWLYAGRRIQTANFRAATDREHASVTATTAAVRRYTVIKPPEISRTGSAARTIRSRYLASTSSGRQELAGWGSPQPSSRRHAGAALVLPAPFEPCHARFDPVDPAAHRRRHRLNPVEQVRKVGLEALGDDVEVPPEFFALAIQLAVEMTLERTESLLQTQNHIAAQQGNELTPCGRADRVCGRSSRRRGPAF